MLLFGVCFILYFLKLSNISVLDLVKQKGFYTFEYGFEKFKEELIEYGFEKFNSSLTGRKISDKEYEHVLIVWKF